MAAPSATCELWLDGVRVPDTGPELLGGAPTALSGLALAWGRDGPNEQPGPATCVVDILDQSPAVDFLDQLHVGSSVAVWAQGEIPADGGPGDYAQTMDDGTFDTYPLGQAFPYTVPASARYFAGAGLVRVSTVAGSPAGAMMRADQDPTQQLQDRWVVYIPPRRFSPTGELPNAWDDLVKFRRGDPVWRFSLAVRAPAGLTLTLYPVAYRSPYAQGGTISAPLVTVAATGGWQTLTGDARPPLPAGADDCWVGLQLLVDGVLSTTWAGMVGTWEDQVGTWAEQKAAPVVDADTALVGRPTAVNPIRRVLVFSGAVSDVKAVPEGAGLLYTVTAADLGADLGNRVVGDDPWPVQTVATRADRVAQLAGITTTPRIRLDAPLGAVQVSARDVDAQPSYALLQDLATTCGGVLWAATHAVTGPFLWMENPDNRAAVAQLELVGGLIVITGQADDVTTISACDVLLDGVEWLQDTQDVATVVAVTWLEQGLDDDGQPTTTERTVTVVDSSPEAAPYGTRRLSISTELVNATDATALANRALVQARAVGWRVEGLTLDTGTMPDQLGSLDAATREIGLLNLLDGTTRMGLALTLVDMPAYAPRGTVSSYYLEGGAYRFAGGRWALELAASPSAGQGKSATWAELDPTWTWAQWDPNIQWQDLYGVAA